MRFDNLERLGEGGEDIERVGSIRDDVFKVVSCHVKLVLIDSGQLP